MNIQFKNSEANQPVSRTILVDELHHSSNDCIDPFEMEISRMTEAQKYSYRDHIFLQVKDSIQSGQLISPNDNIFMIKQNISILTILASHDVIIPTDIFFFIFNFSSHHSLIDSVFLFMKSAFLVNPKLAEQLFQNRSINIQYFIDRFGMPFDESHRDLVLLLVETSKNICEELISLGIIDKIQSSICTTIKMNQDFTHFWCLSYSILNAFVKSCSPNSVLFLSILDLCYLMLTEFYYQNSRSAVFESMKCIQSILSKVDDKRFFENVSNFLNFFDKILTFHDNVSETQLTIEIVAILGTNKNGIDLFNNNYIHHLLDIALTWTPNDFEVPLSIFIKLVTHVLRFHPKFITVISQTPIFSLAYLQFKEGEMNTKETSTLFFARLCNQTFFSNVIDFFENNPVVYEMFCMLEADIPTKTKINTVYGLTSLAANLKKFGRISPNIIAQFTDESSLEAFNLIKNDENADLRNACVSLDQNVNILINDI
ncbi:hypothetical protein TRFO_18171 [Tritrichomonas foetus]|uniref:Uncharacterized protein n=1 Tax=Tritrichomonas foetus TaxID=1144522 RepID=A0A1J4KM05_9EUKA|nr:hypothetical protein TRFO_18171 [Tritrichomonas foetus]|eukprot:OHT12170.1 hypothetical protein TRFO_18171 [Tritrichomonas foetus]